MQLAIKLLPYLGLGISIMVFLGLFFQLARTIERLRIRLGACESQLLQASELSNGINGLSRRMEDLESGASTGQSAMGKGGSLNGTVRSKVLKMHRLGQAPERIADHLKVPKGEVDLLVKVHQIVMRPYEEAPAVPGPAEAS